MDEQQQDVWLRGVIDDGQLIIFGHPDEERHDHSCDEMGCGMEHVILRKTITPEHARQITDTFQEYIALAQRDPEQAAEPSGAK